MTTQTALITGGSRGLGLALAEALAKRGWQLIINARGAEALETAHHQLAQKTTVRALVGDITDAQHRAELTQAAVELGGIDVLVNNASVLGPSPLLNLLDYPLDALRQVYEVNVLAPLALIQELQPCLKTGAKIFNISSDAGREAYPTWGGYGSSKAALEQVSAILAEEQDKWPVYWIDPGDMRTQMHQDAYPGEDISDRPLPSASVPGFLQLIEGNFPSGRYATQSMVAEA